MTSSNKRNKVVKNPQRKDVVGEEDVENREVEEEAEEKQNQLVVEEG